MPIRNDADLTLESVFFQFLFLFSFLEEEGGENFQWMVETGRHGEAGRLFSIGADFE